jgi:hypothetical protein
MGEDKPGLQRRDQNAWVVSSYERLEHIFQFCYPPKWDRMALSPICRKVSPAGPKGGSVCVCVCVCVCVFIFYESLLGVL